MIIMNFIEHVLVTEKKQNYLDQGKNTKNYLRYTSYKVNSFLTFILPTIAYLELTWAHNINNNNKNRNNL